MHQFYPPINSPFGFPYSSAPPLIALRQPAAAMAINGQLARSPLPLPPLAYKARAQVLARPFLLACAPCTFPSSSHAQPPGNRRRAITGHPALPVAGEQPLGIFAPSLASRSAAQEPDTRSPSFPRRTEPPLSSTFGRRRRSPSPPLLRRRPFARSIARW
jgi:hypothetical protein